MSDILSFLQDFDVANFLPAPEKYLRSLVGWVRLLVLIGPLVMLGLGLWYYYGQQKNVRKGISFRAFWGMKSVSAWRFAQKVAGIGYILVGGGLTVLMFVVSLFFSGKHGFVMINIALICVIIELILITLTWITVHLLVYKAYDKEGKPRKQ